MRLSLFLFSVILLCACGSDEKPGTNNGKATDFSAIEELAERGQTIFRDREFGEENVACADCHADFDETLTDEDAIRPGSSILGAHRRARTWNGEFSGEDLLASAAGAAKCAHLYQGRGSSPANAISQSEAEALMAFYEYISTGEEAMLLPWDALTWPGDTSMSREQLKAEIAKLEGIRGNAQRGEVLFKRACAGCHVDGYAPAMRMLRRNVTRNVRAGYGGMPFFSRDKLSDQDVADIRMLLEGK
jgi:mono/diheme cytochrome c family protein